MSSDSTPRDALMRLGASTAEAIAQVLEMFAPGAVERGDVSVLTDGSSPFTGLTPGSVAASVSYVDGVTGANIFVLAPAGVRKLAQAMGMPAPEDGEDSELSELELSAVGEASNQMMAAAASAIGVVLGQEIAISVPDIRSIDDPAAMPDTYGTSPHATSTTFMVAGRWTSSTPRRATPRCRAPPMGSMAAARPRAWRWSRRSGRSNCGCGPSSAAPSWRSAGRSACRSAQWSNSITRPTHRWTCT